VSAADVLEATLQNTVYKSALLSDHNLAVNVSYEFAGLSITAHTLQSGASGALVQVVLAAKSVQVVLAPKSGGAGGRPRPRSARARTGSVMPMTVRCRAERRRLGGRRLGDGHLHR
jgi:hypothetical protein